MFWIVSRWFPLDSYDWSKLPILVCLLGSFLHPDLLEIYHIWNFYFLRVILLLKLTCKVFLLILLFDFIFLHIWIADNTEFISVSINCYWNCLVILQFQSWFFLRLTVLYVLILLLTVELFELLNQSHYYWNSFSHILIDFFIHILFDGFEIWKFENQLWKLFQGVNQIFILAYFPLVTINMVNYKCQNWWFDLPHLTSWIFFTWVLIQPPQASP